MPLKFFKKFPICIGFLCFVFAVVVNAKGSDEIKIEILNYVKNYDISFYYENPNKNKILKYNSEKVYDPASINKVPCALYLYSLAENKKIDLDKKLVYKKEHYYGGAGIIQNEEIGSEYTLRELCKRMIERSDNIAFRMIREEIGENNLIKFCNEELKTPTSAERYVCNSFSAKSIVKWFKYLHNLNNSDSKIYKELASFFENDYFNNFIPAGIPDLRFFHKPGWIPENLVYNDGAIIHTKDGGYYYLIILTKGIALEDREKVIKELTELVNKYNERV